jgi:hypothetical protein
MSAREIVGRPDNFKANSLGRCVHYAALKKAKGYGQMSKTCLTCCRRALYTTKCTRSGGCQ